eukprot:5886666-Prymnesium_polylepis.1
MFEGELFKMNTLRRHRHRIALVLAMTPRAELYGRATGLPSAVLPYGVLPEFGQFAGADFAFRHDLGFSGGWHRLSSRY